MSIFFLLGIGDFVECECQAILFLGIGDFVECECQFILFSGLETLLSVTVNLYCSRDW